MESGNAGKFVQTLEENGCNEASEILSLFGFDGIDSVLTSLAVVNNDVWYDKLALYKALKSVNKSLNITALLNKLNTLPLNAGSNSVYILPVSSFVPLSDELPRNWYKLHSASHLTLGGRQASLWQNQAEDIAYWRDHLPELSIEVQVNGMIAPFYLVKDQTTIPLRGKKITIPINNTFTLPARQEFYKFPLYQEEGKDSMEYAALIKSSDFPLDSDLVCKLNMTYTYGDETPYELFFVPANEKEKSKVSFTRLHVDWVELGDTDEYLDMSAPSFPAPKT
jgi:hypothetical protein